MKGKIKNIQNITNKNLDDLNNQNEENISNNSNENEEIKDDEEQNSIKSKSNNSSSIINLDEEAPIDKINIDMSEIKIRIQSILSILSDLKKKKEPNKSRNDYITELKNLSMQYYDYNNDICDLIFNLFAPNEAIDFMESNTSQKILTIRTNSLKIKRRELAKNLIQRGINLDPVGEWSKVGLKIYSSTVPIGATPEYLSGQYMLQSASSFLPVIALNPQPNEKILDMCASPGGKSTYISQLMKNSGILVSNDLKKERLKSLFFNIHRLGIKNSIITNYDGREFSKLYNKFDRVLLDAPCSGLGVISKDQSVKVNRTYKEILNNSKLQKELILSAIDCVNLKGSSNGIIVYSTCTISVEENEWVIDYALKHRYVKVIDTGFELGENGFVTFREKHFHPSLKKTKRIYPHIHGMDGFFIAKLQKYADGVKNKNDVKNDEKNKKKNKNLKNKKNKNVDEIEENLSEEEEPEDIQISNKKKQSFDIEVDENSEDDGIFNEDDYEKDENDVENDAKKNKKKGRIDRKKNIENKKQKKKDIISKNEKKKNKNDEKNIKKKKKKEYEEEEKEEEEEEEKEEEKEEEDKDVEEEINDLKFKKKKKDKINDKKIAKNKDIKENKKLLQKKRKK